MGVIGGPGRRWPRGEAIPHAQGPEPLLDTGGNHELALAYGVPSPAVHALLPLPPAAGFSANGPANRTGAGWAARLRLQHRHLADGDQAPAASADGLQGLAHLCRDSPRPERLGWTRQS